MAQPVYSVETVSLNPAIPQHSYHLCVLCMQKNSDHCACVSVPLYKHANHTHIHSTPDRSCPTPPAEQTLPLFFERQFSFVIFILVLTTPAVFTSLSWVKGLGSIKLSLIVLRTLILRHLQISDTPKYCATVMQSSWLICSM